MAFLTPRGWLAKITSPRSSIQNRLLISYFLLTAFLIGLVWIAVYKVTEAIVIDQVGESRLEVLDQIGRNVNIIVDEITSVSNMYYFNEQLIALARKNPSADSYERLMEANQVLEIFSHYTYSFDNLQFYSMIHTFNGRAYTSWINDLYDFDSIRKRPWYPGVLQRNGKICWISTFNDKEGFRDDKYVFSAARLWKHYYSAKPLGVIVLNVEETVLEKIYRSALQVGHLIYILDSRGNVVSHPDKRKLGENIAGQKYIRRMLRAESPGSLMGTVFLSKVLYTYYPLPKTGWTLVEEVPLKSVLAPMDKMKYLMVLFLGLGMGMGLFLSYLVARRIASPIRNLHQTMKQVEAGDLDAVAAASGRDEIGELSRGFNRMLGTIKGLMANLKRQANLKRRVELEFLQAQINPHFLYNTLTSIRCMVAMNQNPAAEGMLLALSRLLRRTLGNQDEFVAVYEELEILNDYVAIQSLRYPEKFRVEYAVAFEFMDCQVPKLILQPLVENAIFHGLEPRPEPGTIRIGAVRDGEMLVLTVSDDGVGMTPEQLDQLWRKNRSEQTFSKIGVVNVHERLVLNFGPEFGLKITSEIGRGTTAELRLPVIGAEGRADT